MNDLFRELAPISTAAWAEIEAEAKRTLKLMLAARRIVDFNGPLGWQTSAINTGRSSEAPPRADGIEARLRAVLPLVELRVPFELWRPELEALGRGAKDANLDPVREAARKAGMAEDRAVFHGYPEAHIRGMAEAAS